MYRNFSSDSGDSIPSPIGLSCNDQSVNNHVDNSHSSNNNAVHLPFDAPWLQETLCHFCHQFDKVELTAMEIERISHDRSCTALILRLRLDWNFPNVDAAKRSLLPHHVVLKLPSREKFGTESVDVNREKLEEISKTQLAIMHNQECKAYSFLRSYKHIFPLPVCYYSQMFTLEKPGFLIFEDISGRGRTVDIVEGLSVHQTVSVVSCLAKLHAMCIKDDEWKSQGFRSVSYADLGKMRQRLKKMFESLQAEYGDGQVDISEDEFNELMKGSKWEKIFFPVEGKFVPVLAHGDFWLRNIIFKWDKARERMSDELVAILDWHDVHPGSIMEDVARLLVSSVNVDTRRTYTDTILSRYFRELSISLGAVSEIVPYDLEAVKRMYNEALVHASTMNMATLPQLLAELPDVDARHKLLKRACDACKDTLAVLHQ